MKHAAFALTTAAALLVIAACSTSSSSSSGAPPPDPAGSCDEIARRCHPYDKEPLGHECHELGHDGTDTACAARKAECLTACPPREAGPTTTDAAVDPDAADAGDASPDAAPDTFCTDYCACLTDSCSAIAGYPFAASGSCASHCAVLSADERACWPKFCADSKASTTNKVHLCEHAWGMYGLDECQ